MFVLLRLTFESAAPLGSQRRSTTAASAGVIANGGPKDRKAYIQHDGDIRELKARLSLNTRTDLEAGWPVRILMDDWEATHYYGYNAHTALEYGS